MHKTIRVPDLEQSFRTVLEEVKREHMSYIVTEDSRPGAVLVPYEDFLKLQKFQEEKVLARFDETWARMGQRNASRTDQEIEEDVAAAKDELSRK
ncbi:MAG TPA: type II toxin-antitoxin system prevent-host-death family antitoxin [Thermoanaerobaculia bacterium]|nr:type II toxin-antitoxin system prevent-host-death family antitoxin [Thermoanaerobaculia bacterium]